MPAKKIRMEQLNIVIIAVLSGLVVILLGIVICVCLKKRNKGTKVETVHENHYYQGFEASTVEVENSNIVDKNDYYQVNE